MTLPSGSRAPGGRWLSLRVVERQILVPGVCCGLCTCRSSSRAILWPWGQEYQRILQAICTEGLVLIVASRVHHSVNFLDGHPALGRTRCGSRFADSPHVVGRRTLPARVLGGKSAPSVSPARNQRQHWPPSSPYAAEVECDLQEARTMGSSVSGWPGWHGPSAVVNGGSGSRRAEAVGHPLRSGPCARHGWDRPQESCSTIHFMTRHYNSAAGRDA